MIAVGGLRWRAHRDEAPSSAARLARKRRRPVDGFTAADYAPAAIWLLLITSLFCNGIINAESRNRVIRKLLN